MDIKLSFFGLKSAKLPTRCEQKENGALIKCMVDGVETDLSVLFKGYDTQSASTVSLRILLHRNGFNYRSVEVFYKSCGYGYARMLNSAAKTYEMVFGHESYFRNYSERLILTDLANRISTVKNFVLYDGWGIHNVGCEDGAEPLTIV